MEPRGRGLFLVLLLLTAAAGAVLVAEGRPRRDVRVAQFQQLVGGVGFGPALDLSGCAFGLDPRLDGDCSQDAGPIPGGACFCPRHPGSILPYGPLEEADETPP